MIPPVERFKLVGHFSPLGEYPAPVVAIGHSPQGLVAIWFTEEGASAEPWHGELAAIVALPRQSRAMQIFEPGTHALFAISAEDLRQYELAEEAAFFRSLLQGPELKDADPAVRYSLACHCNDAEILIREAGACFRALARWSPAFAQVWLEREREQAVGHVRRWMETIGDAVGAERELTALKSYAADGEMRLPPSPMEALTRALTGYVQGFGRSRREAEQISQEALNMVLLDDGQLPEQGLARLGVAVRQVLLGPLVQAGRRSLVVRDAMPELVYVSAALMRGVRSSAGNATQLLDLCALGHSVDEICVLLRLRPAEVEATVAQLRAIVEKALGF